MLNIYFVIFPHDDTKHTQTIHIPIYPQPHAPIVLCSRSLAYIVTSLKECKQIFIQLGNVE